MILKLITNRTSKENFSFVEHYEDDNRSDSMHWKESRSFNENRKKKTIKIKSSATNEIDEIEHIVLNQNDGWSRKNSKEKFN